MALLIPQLSGGFQILALEAAQVCIGQHLLDGGLVRIGQIGVLVQLGLEPLHFLEVGHKGGAGRIALQVGHL